MSDALISLLLVPPAAACALALLLRNASQASRAAAWLNVVSLAAAVALGRAVLQTNGPIEAASGFWRVDALSAVMALSVAGVTFVTSLFGPDTRRFRALVNAFALTMLVAVTTNNVGIMWVAIEATTITSALVIPLNRTKASVEASWKYLLICSVGIALAFTGTVLAYFDFVSTAGHLPSALNWTTLRVAAPRLHRELVELAFAFILVGYGTKAGLAPMHTWLPDAHSEAPSPLSAMMSGVLLGVALYAVARWKAVVDAAIGSGFAAHLLVSAGLLSIVIGAFSLVIQRHYKRMLAYSSVEHIGLVSVGLGLGPLGIVAAILHLVNHAVAKSMAFLLAGRILDRYKTSEIDGVSGLLRAMPWTGSLFAAGVLALVGLPPFGLFVSEFLLIKAAVVTGRVWLAAAVLVLVLIAFVSLINHLNRMLYGPVPDGVATGERGGLEIVVLGACAVILVVLGLVLPGPLSRLIDHAAQVLSE
jgi:hydrogenase-4 component F